MKGSKEGTEGGGKMEVKRFLLYLSFFFVDCFFKRELLKHI